MLSLHTRFYPDGSAENREDLRSMKKRKARIAIGKAVADGSIKKAKQRVGSRGKTPLFVLSFISNPVGSFAAYLLFTRQTDREPVSIKPYFRSEVKTGKKF